MTTRKVLYSMLSMVFVLAMAMPVYGQEVVSDYLFAGNLADSLGNAPALTELVPDDGSYVEATLDGLSTTGYRFSAGAGLQLSTVGLLDNDEYTVAIIMAFDQVTGYRKVLDLQALAFDEGLYVHGGSLNFYRGSAGSNNVIQADTFYQLVLTRSADGVVTGYVDGVEQFTFDDGTTNYGVITAENLLTFFRDDGSTGNVENSAGIALRIRLFNAALDAGKVAELETRRIGKWLFTDRFEK